MAKIEIELDAEGFENIWDNSMAWGGTDWAAQDGRFDPMPDYNFEWAYFYASYLSALISISYLKSIREKATLHSDEAGGWLIVTNFMSPCHEHYSN